MLFFCCSFLSRMIHTLYQLDKHQTCSFNKCLGIQTFCSLNAGDSPNQSPSFIGAWGTHPLQTIECDKENTTCDDSEQTSYYNYTRATWQTNSSKFRKIEIYENMALYPHAPIKITSKLACIQIGPSYKLVTQPFS